MSDDQVEHHEPPSAPDSTAVRVALWRALHLEVDDAPPVFVDDVGMRLAQPDPDWRSRGDMTPDATAAFRASIVARARFVDDLVCECAAEGIDQYVVLGAGLDTFAQRHPELTDRLRIYEVDRPGTQEWKRRRLIAEGYPLPTTLRLVPVDFESGQSWWDSLQNNGFDASRPAVVASTGVSMYLTKAATEAIAEYLGVELPSAELPEPRDSRFAPAYGHLVGLLRSMEPDGVMLTYQTRMAFRLARQRLRPRVAAIPVCP